MLYTTPHKSRLGVSEDQRTTLGRVFASRFDAIQEFFEENQKSA